MCVQFTSPPAKTPFVILEFDQPNLTITVIIAILGVKAKKVVIGVGDPS